MAFYGTGELRGGPGQLLFRVCVQVSSSSRAPRSLSLPLFSPANYINSGRTSTRFQASGYTASYAHTPYREAPDVKVVHARELHVVARLVLPAPEDERTERGRKYRKIKLGYSL